MTRVETSSLLEFLAATPRHHVAKCRLPELRTLLARVWPVMIERGEIVPDLAADGEIEEASRRIVSGGYLLSIWTVEDGPFYDGGFKPTRILFTLFVGADDVRAMIEHCHHDAFVPATKSNPKPPKPERSAVHVGPPGAKLTAAAVREIRRQASEGATTAEISRRFPVTAGTIWSIVHRRSWADIE